MYRKSHLAKRELLERRRVQEEAKSQKAMQRSQSSLPGTAVTTSMLDPRRGREPRHHSAMPGTTTMPEYLSNAGHRTPPLIARPPIAVPPPVPAAAETSPIIADTPTVISSVSLPTPTVPSPPSVPAPSTPPRKRAESMAPTLTPKQSALPSITGLSTMAVEDESIMVDPSPERPLMSANKNRHTIQVEYDGEASYEKWSEALEAKRAARRPQDEGSPKALQPTSMVRLASSDVEMESGSSDGGHIRYGPIDAPAPLTTSDAPTPETSQVGTPLATTPPMTTALEAVPVSSASFASPSTPVKQSQTAVGGVGSPSTPRAFTNVVSDVTATPRGEPSPSATPKASIRQSAKRLNSDFIRAVQPEPAPTPTKSADLKASGLPKVPRPKQDRSRKGMSLDKFGLAKLLGQAGSTTDDSRLPPSAGGSAAAIHAAQNEEAQRTKRTSIMRPKTADVDSTKDKKSSRRRTLQLMVNR